jgi:outer membrane protein, heavy metal efflux system
MTEGLFAQRQFREKRRKRVLAHQKAGCCFTLLVLLAGCATVDQRAGFSEVGTSVQERTGMVVVWNRGTELDAQAAQKVRSLLEGKLTAGGAVQVALLNNRGLQAVYSELGVAQADLVQAGLLKNPIFGSAIRFPLSGGQAELTFSVAMDFLDILYTPLRKRLAAARFEDAKLHVSGAVLDFAAQVQVAFYRHQANEQMLDMRQTIAQALSASFEVARRLHEAGNIKDLDLARERAQAEEANVQLRFAETAVRQSRERLNALMGLWGKETVWVIDRRLPDIPVREIDLRELESLAIRRSIDLASARQHIVVAGERLGFNRTTALVPELPLGVEAKREEGWEVGPELVLPVPLFDQGQARIGLAVAELRRAHQEYYALAVRVRSTARGVRDRLQGARDRALYYRDILLPLRERILNEAQLQYNAMQLGVIDLLRVREEQIQAAVAYVEALLDYWSARTDLEQVIRGRLPAPESIQTGLTVRPKNMVEH